MYDFSVNTQPSTPRYWESLRQDQQRKSYLLASGTDFFFPIFPFSPSFLSLSYMWPSQIYPHTFHVPIMIDPLLRSLSIHSAIAPQLGFKVQSFHQLKVSSCSCFYHWANAETQLAFTACPAKYACQSCLGMSSRSTHGSDRSDFKYLLNFLQGE